MSAKPWTNYLFKLGMLDALAYRADFLLGLISGLTLIMVQYFLWTAIFAGKPQIADFSLVEAVTYMAMVWITRGFYDTEWQARATQNKILNGSISYELTYPLDYQRYLFLLTYARNGLNFLLSGLPAFLAAVLLFHIRIPSLAEALFFILSIHLSFAISAGLAFILGWCSVYFKRTEGLLQAEKFVQTLFSGALVPLAFLPGWMGGLAAWLPFQGIVSTPILIFLGKVQGLQLLQALGFQLVWALGLWGFGKWFYLRARQKLEVFGG